MIRDIQVSHEEVTVGQTVSIVVYADSPISVSIGCFIDRPPPPRFSDCPECSVMTVQSGEEFTLHPRLETWQSKQGGYEIRIKDAQRDERKVRIRVSTIEGTSNAQGFMTM